MVAVAAVFVVGHLAVVVTVAKHLHLGNEFEVGQSVVLAVVVAVQLHPAAAAAAFARDRGLLSPPVK